MKLEQHLSWRAPLDGCSFALAGGVLALSLLALPGCNDDPALGAVRGVTAGESAANRMVSEYCNQEASCGAIRRDDEALCETRLQNVVLDEYDTATCNERVSETELGRCVQAIHNGDCGDPLDSLSQLDSCRARRVCRPPR
jgi:hypothetical protein